ncbi:hypothetical protein BV898_18471 [Hypsibius exemplaris]|uniref:Uncharacterized protein n=1 Tax=Hypsibius exemplaris TaxID=2072580 RepID=A0A9X6RN24_HYPEX|nr:hypothetical protein BV898_18471 [Hypsibius exemplaris]
MIMWGDTSHLEALQFPDPRITVKFDVNEEEARQTRLELMCQIAEKKYLVAAAHMAFPGIGHLRSVGNATVGSYEWVPVIIDWEPTRVKTANFSV